MHVIDGLICGSYWAFGAAEFMSHRICIASNATQNTHISAENILSIFNWFDINVMKDFLNILAYCSSCGDCSGGSPVIIMNIILCFSITGIRPSVNNDSI